MFIAEEELARLLRRAGVGPWVTDEYGRNMQLDDWAAYFVKEIAAQIHDEAATHASQLEDLRDLLSEKPRKMIAVAKIRELIEY